MGDQAGGRDLTRLRLANLESETLSTGGHPAAVTLDESGSVWVLNGFEAKLVRIDAEQMVVEETIQLTTGTRDLAAGLGAVWVTNANEKSLTRVDLVTGDLERVDLSAIGTPDGVAVSDDGLGGRCRRGRQDRPRLV